MIPIRDTQVSTRFPLVTYTLIGINALLFLVQIQVGFDNEAFFYTWGLVPAKYTVDEMSRYFSFVNQMFSVLSHMFLHGGLIHFLGNMWSLYIFGDNVEEHFGSVRFLLFYLISGLVSATFHFMVNPVSPIPTIGASGAIAGVMGAYFLLYPRSRILTVIPIIIIPFFIEIPAFVFLGLWFLLQLLNAAGSSAGAGIAWWAHIGGFVAGLAMVHLNKRVPASGASDRIGRFTAKKRTPKLQRIVTAAGPDSADLYGDLEVSSLEAITGSRKLVTIPWGFYQPLYRVRVPAGVKQGTRLRLKGMGRTMPDGLKGDLYLKVKIKNAI
jgi:membrane associated rhomboid family serine protease